MRKKKPCVAVLDQVRIRREGSVAIIERMDADVATVHLEIGALGRNLTDQQILDLYNATIRTQQELARRHKHVAVEVPQGCPQIRYFDAGEQWVPRGNVLRCLIDDGGPDGGEPTVTIDDHELSLAEFGRLLCTHAGWGMRITFVPNDEIGRLPTVEIRDPGDDT